jgi:hypothetical protein
MEENLAKVIEVSKYDAIHNKKVMKDQIGAFSEDGRRGIRQSLETLFRLKQNTNYNTRQMQTLTELRDIGIKKIKKGHHNKQNYISENHEERMEKMKSECKIQIDDKHKQIKDYMKNMNIKLEEQNKVKNDFDNEIVRLHEISEQQKMIICSGYPTMNIPQREKPVFPNRENFNLLYKIVDRHRHCEILSDRKVCQNKTYKKVCQMFKRSATTHRNSRRSGANILKDNLMFQTMSNFKDIPT